MPARLRLTLMVVGTIAVLAIALTVVLARTDSSAAPQLGRDGWAGAISPPGVPASDFTLRDQDGKTVSLSSYRGQIVILTFLYSTCQDTCPVAASTIRGALDDLPHDVPSLAVSVDPKNDTPDSAKKFLLKQHVNGRMDFLLGTQAQLAPIWKAYGIQPQLPGPATNPKYEHSARILLLDRTGRQRIAFPIQQATSEGISHDVKRLERLERTTR
jgi:protein SCO1/2